MAVAVPSQWCAGPPAPAAASQLSGTTSQLSGATGGCCGGPPQPVSSAPVQPLPPAANGSEALSFDTGDGHDCPTCPKVYVSLQLESRLPNAGSQKTVETSLKKVPGVLRVTFNDLAMTARVQVMASTSIRPTDLVSVLSDMGIKSACTPASETSGVQVSVKDPALWSFADELGLVMEGCSMGWGEECQCEKDACLCVNCAIHDSKANKLRLQQNGCCLCPPGECLCTTCTVHDIVANRARLGMPN
ncbi:unnamed protein product [Chrysoparadoxa australica]